MQITPFQLEQWYFRYEFSSKFNLSASGIEPNKIEFTTENIPALGYLPANGSQPLREILGKKYEISPEQIVITNGAIEAVFLLQLALLEKGDQLLCVTPVYPALVQMAIDLGAKVNFWSVGIENNLLARPDLEKLKKLIISKRPKMLIINFPNNPTGIDLSFSEFSEIVTFAEKYNCLVLSDEVYRELAEKPFPNLNMPNLIRVSSLSKAYGFPGLRTGWLIANPEIIAKCINLKHYTTLCNNFLGEFFALTVLEKADEYLKRSHNLLKTNLAIVLARLEEGKEKFALEYVKPDQGLMIFVKLAGVPDTEAFCETFEAEESILLLPGKKYGEIYRQFFRLGFGMETEKLVYCLNRFGSFCQKFLK